MQYCTFHFNVTFRDSTSLADTVPYRHEKVDNDQLVRFCEGFFLVGKPHEEEHLVISDVRYSCDPKAWHDAIMLLPSFEYLRGVNNFAGDLIEEYYPDMSREQFH